MDPYRGQRTDGHDGEQAWDPFVTPYSSNASQASTVAGPHLPSQGDSDRSQHLSSSPFHPASTPHTPYGPPNSIGQHYQADTGHSGHPMHFQPEAPQAYWQDSLHRTGVQPSHYDPTRGSHLATNSDTYVLTPAFSSVQMDSGNYGTTGDPLMDVEDRRPTITQDTFNNSLRGRTPYGVDHHHSLQYNVGSSGDPFPERHTRHTHGSEDHRTSNVRNIRRAQRPYEHSSRVSRPQSLSNAGDLYAPPHGPVQGPRFAPAMTAGIAIPPPPMGLRQSNINNPHYPARETSPYSHSLPARSPRPDWPIERSGSSAATPASTEGSADPAQSDQDEYDPRGSTSTSPQTSTSVSTSPSSTASRWARFRVPADIYTDPFDHVRHELYHQIRREEWFLNQVQERPITALEASRIPGSIPGESILLAFYDRVTDTLGKTSMRCTICMKTNPQAQLYPRPDRAKVHMRHHLELRPIPCNGKCETVGCTQRFFTTGDLGAHVTGKTEPLATCEYCRKTMRAKNLKRHITHFCHRAPPELRAKRRA